MMVESELAVHLECAPELGIETVGLESRGYFDRSNIIETGRDVGIDFMGFGNIWLQQMSAGMPLL